MYLKNISQSVKIGKLSEEDYELFFNDLNVYKRSKDTIASIREFLKNEPDVNVKDKHGWTILHYLCADDQIEDEMRAVEVVKELIARGADPYSRDGTYNNNAIQMALKNKYFDIVTAIKGDSDL